MEPGGGKQFLELYEASLETYYLTRPVFDPDENLFNFFFKNPQAMIKTRPLTTLMGLLKKHFRNAYIHSLFGMYALFSGENPFHTPNGIAMITCITINEGVKYLQGGLGEIAKTLEAVALEHGVDIRTSTAVAEILVDGKKAVGLGLENGERHQGGIIVANANRPHVMNELLHGRGKMNPAKFTSSGLVYLLGVEGLYPELTFSGHIMPHNFKETMRLIHKEKKFPFDDPMFWVVNPPPQGRVAPAGHSA